MKCEHCGKNEVTFVYQSNVNGKVTEAHLCSECAEKLGYLKPAAARGQQRSLFGDNFFGEGFLNDFFSPMPSLLGRMSRMMEDPFEDFFARMPALSAAPAKTEESQKQEDLVDNESQSRFSRMREMNALRMEMKKAVHQENFERAAQLRDQIRAMEAEHKEKKEQE